ncbi:unnamed protein product [Lactuca saligna]|uniref:Uncharacterized protein n=1 Tax=Lactuca saligna TaxID=75948 RepID=A0AA35YQS1_LACSI|nr:unnamed protein product [Lactuca saligna]
MLSSQLFVDFRTSVSVHLPPPAQALGPISITYVRVAYIISVICDYSFEPFSCSSSKSSLISKTSSPQHDVFHLYFSLYLRTFGPNSSASNIETTTVLVLCRSTMKTLQRSTIISSIAV